MINEGVAAVSVGNLRAGLVNPSVREPADCDRVSRGRDPLYLYFVSPFFLSSPDLSARSNL